MNKPLTLLLAAAIISPAFALAAPQPRTPVLALIAQNATPPAADAQSTPKPTEDNLKPQAMHHRRHHAKKAKPAEDTPMKDTATGTKP